MENDLNRFILKQKEQFIVALKEIQNGRKRSHWMWFVFPQIKGLGSSDMANYYAISDLQEAKEYLSNAYLRRNLLLISEALLKLESNDAVGIFGVVDAMKLKSCMTLFLMVEPENNTFDKVLDKFFEGKRDEKTVNILNK